MHQNQDGQSLSAFCDEIVPKIQEIVERDARYTVCDTAQINGISLSRVHYILKNILHVRKISARLADGQKKPS